MIHGSTNHAPRSFGFQDPVKEPEKPKPIDVADRVMFLRKKKTSCEFEIRCRSRKLSTILSLTRKIQEIDKEILELGFPLKVKRGRKKKGQI